MYGGFDRNSRAVVSIEKTSGRNAEYLFPRDLNFERLIVVEIVRTHYSAPLFGIAENIIELYGRSAKMSVYGQTRVSS